VAAARHDELIEAGRRWAETDERIRALLLKGSLGRGEGDERSDLDLVVVTRPGRLAELWDERNASAESLGGWLGGFDEMPWQAPHTFIGFYDGPVKVDFFYQEGEPDADPWLRDGFAALVDPDGVAESLRGRLIGAADAFDLSTFDAHAWDWLWWMDVKLSRGGEAWLVYLELVKFAETMLLGGHNALTPEPWRGASAVEERLPAELQAELRGALPTGPEPAEIRRALDNAIAAYERLRPRLAAKRRMPLAEELAQQIRDRVGGP
jgi:predicted nucleotidyltransferase